MQPAVNLFDYERLAKARMTSMVFDYYAGGAMDEITLKANHRALPEVVEAVAGRVEVLVDGGIRRGTDVLKALALGACAVQGGRPVLWGLAVDGEAGVRHVLELLRTEFDSAMALCGCRNVAEITRDLIG